MPSRCRRLRVLRTLSVLAALSLAACATTQTTPRQDYIYDIGRNCETPTTKIERVDPDGRYWIFERGVHASNTSEYQRFVACMKAQFQAHPFLDWLKAHKREAAEQPLDRAKRLNAEVEQLYEQARYGEAIPQAREALALREQALEPTHPDVAQSLNNLALLLRATGDSTGARPLYERALRIREQALGPTHPAVAESLNNLAFLLQTRGDYAGARALYERARLVDLALSRTSVELEDDEVRGLRRDFGSQRALRRYVG